MMDARKFHTNAASLHDEVDLKLGDFVLDLDGFMNPNSLTSTSLSSRKKMLNRAMSEFFVYYDSDVWLQLSSKAKDVTLDMTRSSHLSVFPALPYKVKKCDWISFDLEAYEISIETSVYVSSDVQIVSDFRLFHQEHDDLTEIFTITSENVMVAAWKKFSFQFEDFESRFSVVDVTTFETCFPHDVVDLLLWRKKFDDENLLGNTSFHRPLHVFNWSILSIVLTILKQLENLMLPETVHLHFFLIFLFKFKGGIIILTTFHKGHSRLQFSQMFITVLHDANIKRNGKAMKMPCDYREGSINSLFRDFLSEKANELVSEKPQEMLEVLKSGGDIKVICCDETDCQNELILKSAKDMFLPLKTTDFCSKTQIKYFLSKNECASRAFSDVHADYPQEKDEKSWAICKKTFVEETVTITEKPEALLCGRVSNSTRDPPGQQSKYIPPGDVRSEVYRLSTFKHYPIKNPTTRQYLSKSGFYFTGYNNRVKCFACGISVEDWAEFDNPSDPRWHETTCPMVQGIECGNIPMRKFFQLNSLRSTVLQDGTQRSQNPTIVAQSSRGFDVSDQMNNESIIFSGQGNQSVIIGGALLLKDQPQNIRVAASQLPHQPTRQWKMANVVSTDHRRFLSNLYLNRELDRLASFARWPVSRPTVSPESLARTGFFYLGDMDRTQCFSCGGVLRNWTINDDAFVEHRTHFRQCPMVLGAETRNVPALVQPESQAERERNFPCRFPSNPHMRSEALRLDTFDRRWPIGRTAATPAEIAQAGFFFLGERDRVKCWYCNGGLQNWDYDDSPWVEHAKWFPNCQFLLRTKGQHFVMRHLAGNAHLARPIIAKQDGATIDPNGPADVCPPSRGMDVPPAESPVEAPSAVPTIIDPREEMRKRKERVKNLMETSDSAKFVIAMGFDKKKVESLIEDKVNSDISDEEIYPTIEALLDDVLKNEEDFGNSEQMLMEEVPAAAGARAQAGPSSFGTVSSVYTSMTTPSNMSLGTAPGSGKYNVSYDFEDDGDINMYDEDPNTSLKQIDSVSATHQTETPESMQEALEKIEEESMCKICFSSKADMLFVPCNHMVCCMNCTEAIRNCPLCRVKIERAIKTYID